MQYLSHWPAFPAVNTGLTSTFLQLSHQCTPLRVLDPLTGMKLQGTSCWACGDGHLELTELERLLQWELKWQHWLGILKKTQIFKKTSKCSWLYLLCRDLSSDSIHCLSRLQNLFPRVCFWFFIQNRQGHCHLPKVLKIFRDYAVHRVLSTVFCNGWQTRFLPSEANSSKEKCMLGAFPPHFPFLRILLEHLSPATSFQHMVH